MNDLFSYGLLVFTSFFTLVNPLGVMPIFLAVTADQSVAERNRTAKRATLTAFLIMLIFGLSGQLLFKFFGISIGGFKVAGGIIFLKMGMDMIQGRMGSSKANPSEVKTYENDVSVTPLAIPIISGPGALTNAIILMEEAHSFPQKIVFIVTLALIMVVTCLILLSATKIMKLVGDKGMNMVLRLMGMIIMVIAVEFFFGGIKDIFNLH